MVSPTCIFIRPSSLYSALLSYGGMGFRFPKAILDETCYKVQVNMMLKLNIHRFENQRKQFEEEKKSSKYYFRISINHMCNIFANLRSVRHLNCAVT